MQLDVALALRWLTALLCPPSLDDLVVGDALEVQRLVGGRLGDCRLIGGQGIHGLLRLGKWSCLTDRYGERDRREWLGNTGGKQPLLVDVEQVAFPHEEAATGIILHAAVIIGVAQAGSHRLLPLG